MNIDRIIRWGLDNLFILLLAVYSLLFFSWYLILPIDDYVLDLGTFYLGLWLLAFSAIFFILRLVFTKIKPARSIFSIALVPCLILTGCHLFSFMPDLEQTAVFNGKVYFLTSHREFLGNGMSSPLLARWDGPLRHTVSGMGGAWGDLRLTYDTAMGMVSVVRIMKSTETLVYSDADPPRFFEADTQFGDFRYYPAWYCGDVRDSMCQTFIYTVYRCTLENTNCVQLPFRYSGDSVRDIAMSQDEQTHEISIVFWIGDYPGTSTLIFTYGDPSRCHVAGCQIIN